MSRKIWNKVAAREPLDILQSARNNYGGDTGCSARAWPTLLLCIWMRCTDRDNTRDQVSNKQTNKQTNTVFNLPLILSGTALPIIRFTTNKQTNKQTVNLIMGRAVPDRISGRLKTVLGWRLGATYPHNQTGPPQQDCPDHTPVVS